MAEKLQGLFQKYPQVPLLYMLYVTEVFVVVNEGNTDNYDCVM